MSTDSIKNFSFFYLSKAALKKKLIKHGFKNITFMKFVLNNKIINRNSASKIIKIGNKNFISLLGPIIQPWFFVIAEKK